MHQGRRTDIKKYGLRLAETASSVRSPVLFALLLILSTIISGHIAYATSIVLDVNEEKRESSHLLIPYVFPDTATGLAFGPAMAWKGYGQEQMSLLGALMYSSNGSKGIFFLERNYQVPWAKRFFIDVNAIVADYEEIRAYVDGLPGFPDRAGSNDSDPDDYMVGFGEDRWGEIRLKYLLPIGSGRDTIINTFRVKHGLLVDGATGGDEWNPFDGGRTTLEIRFFYRGLTFDSPDDPVGGREFETNGIRLSMEYDNTDFWVNPTRGSITNLAVARDFGWFGSSNTWSTVEGEYSKFIDLGTTSSFRQIVLALDAWTIESPTWESNPGPLGTELEHGPPSFLGATLGGFWRLRAYPRFRFHGKSAIYYAAEWRLTPYWNPLASWKLIKSLEMDWWQFVPFVEAGRVTDEAWDLGDLHEDMQWAAGVGVRFMLKRMVARVDVATSDESTGVKVMVNQPF